MDVDVDEEEVISPPQNFLDQLRSKLPPPLPKIPTIEEFTEILKESHVWSNGLDDDWSILSQPAKMKYIRWFFSDRHKRLSDVLYDNSELSVNDLRLIAFFEKFTKDISEQPEKGGSRRRRRRSLPKSSRKYKKSKRVFRKKSRSTKRR